MGVEDKLPSGAGLTSAEKRAGWARARSLWPTTFGLACFAWVGQRLWLAARTVIRAVRLANDQQVHMWECVLITSGAAPLTAAGPLRWVPSLGGYRLVGSHLPAQNPSETGR